VNTVNGVNAMTDVAGAEPLLSAREVSVSFPVGSRVGARMRREEHLLRAVDGVDLEMGRGEALALVGESGSGKSTLAQALAGLQPTDRGEIRFDGRVLPASRSRADRRRIQMVFQDPYSSLNPRMTVGGMLRELLRVHHVVPANRVATFSAELLALVGLSEADLSSYPRQFSGGQRQRVAIAAALALEPDVLVADEPVSMLDVSVRAGVLNVLDGLRRNGLAILMITHDLSTAARFAQRIAVMYLGRIVEEGPTAAVVRNPQHPYTKALLSVVPRRDPRDRQRPQILQGETPDAVAIPPGCRFHPRCPIAEPRCSLEDPALEQHVTGERGHRAACLLLPG
jgi:oligopeptide transport system ATP-binding protein